MYANVCKKIKGNNPAGGDQWLLNFACIQMPLFAFEIQGQPGAVWG